MALDPDVRATWTASAGVAVVALTAAVISFSHVRRLSLEAGETQLAAWLLPVSIDGAIVAAVAVILADSRAGRRPARLTWLLLALGLAGSLAANIASAEPTLTARAVAAWPPVGLALGIEVLASLARRRDQCRALPDASPVVADSRPPMPGRLAVPSGHPLALVPADRPAQPTAARPAIRRKRDDASAVAVIQELDEAAPGGRASRQEIQRRLGCGGSKAARLAELARQPVASPVT